MPESKILTRKLEPFDAALYRDIRLEALHRNPEAFGSTYTDEEPRPMTWFEERLSKTFVFGSFQDSHLLGIAGFYIQHGIKTQHKGVLWGMYVRPQARKMGLGQKLVEAVILHAQEYVELLQLMVLHDNEQALHLYERCGFTAYGLEKDSLKYKERYYDELLMARQIRPTP